MAGSFACICGVVTAETISMHIEVICECSGLTGALRFGSEDGSIGRLGRDSGTARRRGHRSIGARLQRREGGRVDIEPLFGVLILAQLEGVVDVGAG